MYPGMLLHTLYGLIHFISTIIVCGIYYNIPCVVQKRGSENSINVCKLHSWWVMRQSGPSLKCTPSTLPHTHGRQDWQAPSQCWGLTNSTETRNKQISQDKATWCHLAQITFIRCFTPVCAPSHWSQMGQAGKTFRVQEQVCVCDIIQVKPLHELEWAKLLQTIKSWVLFIVPSTVIVANLVLDTHACIDPANIYKHSTFLNTRETGSKYIPAHPQLCRIYPIQDFKEPKNTLPFVQLTDLQSDSWSHRTHKPETNICVPCTQSPSRTKLVLMLLC